MKQTITKFFEILAKDAKTEVETKLPSLFRIKDAGYDNDDVTYVVLEKSSRAKEEGEDHIGDDEEKIEGDELTAADITAIRKIADTFPDKFEGCTATVDVLDNNKSAVINVEYLNEDEAEDARKYVQTKLKPLNDAIKKKTEEENKAAEEKARKEEREAKKKEAEKKEKKSPKDRLVRQLMNSHYKGMLHALKNTSSGVQVVWEDDEGSKLTLLTFTVKGDKVQVTPYHNSKTYNGWVVEKFFGQGNYDLDQEAFNKLPSNIDKMFKYLDEPEQHLHEYENKGKKLTKDEMQKAKEAHDESQPEGKKIVWEIFFKVDKNKDQIKEAAWQFTGDQGRINFKANSKFGNFIYSKFVDEHDKFDTKAFSEELAQELVAMAKAEHAKPFPKEEQLEHGMKVKVHGDNITVTFSITEDVKSVLKKII